MGVPVLRLGDARLEWELEGRPIPERRVETWLRGAADAVATWFDGFPTDAAVRVVGESGASVRFGQANSGDPPEVTVWVGADATAATLRSDWVLVHEMLHLGFPGMPSRHAWLYEGMATYMEPLARAAGGLRSERSAWTALANSLSDGEPRRGDGGLEGPRNWARTYWGGALWCFAADVGLRQASGGEFGLREVAGRFAHAGGTLREYWPIQRVIAGLDEVSGTSVCGELYDRHAHDAVPFGFDALWREGRAVGLVPLSA